MMEFIENLAQQSKISVDEAFKAVMDKVGVPLGRMAEPEARYITGVNYSVDGGALPTVQ